MPNALVYHSKYFFQILEKKFWYPFQSIINANLIFKLYFLDKYIFL